MVPIVAPALPELGPVEDEPMVSLYNGTREDPRKSENVVSLR